MQVLLCALLLVAPGDDNQDTLGGDQKAHPASAETPESATPVRESTTQPPLKGDLNVIISEPDILGASDPRLKGTDPLLDESDKLLVFHADWCTPCRQMSPIVDRLIKEGLPFRYVDVDKRSDVAKRYKVKRIPCFVAVRDRREHGRLEGTTSRAKLQAFAQAQLIPNSPVPPQIKYAPPSVYAPTPPNPPRPVYPPVVDPAPIQPVPSAETTKQSKADDVLKAAKHLAAEGLLEEAARLRKIGRSWKLKEELGQKLLQLKRLEQEIDALREQLDELVPD